jgi:hypothetical protein
VLVPEGDVEVGGEPEIADARVLELEQDACEAGFQEVRRLAELRRRILDLFQVDGRVSSHGIDPPLSQSRGAVRAPSSKTGFKSTGLTASSNKQMSTFVLPSLLETAAHSPEEDA